MRHSPERPRVQPPPHINQLEAGASPVFAAAAPELIFGREARRPTPPQPVDLPPRQSRHPRELLHGDEGREICLLAVLHRLHRLLSRDRRCRANARSLSRKLASMAGISSWTGSASP